MQKYSKVPEMIAAVPTVVDEEIKNFETRPRYSYNYNEETKSVESSEIGVWIKTPFGEVADTDTAIVRDLMVKQSIKNIYQKYGRSKYMPHQGAKEVARRKARLNA